MKCALPLVSALLCSCIIVPPLPPEEQRGYAPAPAPGSWADVPPAPAPEAQAWSAPPPAPVAPSTPTPPPPSPPSNPHALVFTCEGVKLEEQYQYMSRECEGFSAVPVQAVAGLEAMPEALRQCLLTAIPMPPPGATHSDCQLRAAQRLSRRLDALGWLDAKVHPVRIPGAGARGGPPWLHVEPGGRYQIGDLHMDYFSGIELKRENVLEEARKAIPESSPWAIEATREAIRQRILAMGAFEQVSVSQMNRNNQTLRLPLEISVKFTPSLAARARGCKRKEGFCLMGSYQCKIDPRTGCQTTPCKCVGNSPLGWR